MRAALPLSREVQSIGELLRVRSREQPDHPLLRWRDAPDRAYRDVDLETDELASALVAVGVEQGDRVAMLTPNRPEFLLIWLAVAKIGAVLAPMDPEYKRGRLVDLVRAVGAKVLVADAGLAQSVSDVVDAVPDVDHVVWLDPRGDEPALSSVRELTYAQLRAAGTGSVPEVEVRETDPLILLFTSGTTGRPKPVDVSHGFALHEALELETHVGYAPDDTFYTCYPLFHADATLSTFIPALWVGGTCALGRGFSASRFLDDVRTAEATVFTGMGAVISILCKQPEKDDDRDNPLRLAIGGAVPSSTPYFENRFGLRVIELYGATECCLVSYNVDGEHEIGICGRVCEHHEVRIVDERDRELPRGAVGQILVRGRVPNSAMTGYFGDPDATLSAWRNLWYHTGDLGRLDENDVLRFEGRLKDVIRRRQVNIPPAIIEDCLNHQPSVRECAAIGVPSELTEEDVKVVVVPAAGHESLTADQVRQFTIDELPKHMWPRYVEVVEVLPKTPTGKINKARLRESWRGERVVDYE